MKFIIYLIFFSPLAILAQTNSTVKSGTLALEPFDKVEASMGINITLEEDNVEKMDVRIENGEVGDVAYSVEGRTLKVKMKNRIGKGVVVRCIVYYKTLIEISSSTGATIDNSGVLYGDILKLRASSDATITLNVDVNQIEASSTVGRITLSGETQYQEVVANTGGKYLAKELESNHALLKGNTGASIEVNVAEKVEAKASMGSSIEIIGDPPSVKWEENMGGKVSPH